MEEKSSASKRRRRKSKSAPVSARGRRTLQCPGCAADGADVIMWRFWVGREEHVYRCNRELPNGDACGRTWVDSERTPRCAECDNLLVVQEHFRDIVFACFECGTASARHANDHEMGHERDFYAPRKSRGS